MKATKREEFMAALMECSTVTAAYQKAEISKRTAYNYLGEKDFQRDLSKLKREVLASVTNYLQSKLARCSEALMHVVEDPKVSDQVRINAINSVFTNCRVLTENVDLADRISDLEERAEIYDLGGV